MEQWEDNKKKRVDCRGFIFRLSYVAPNLPDIIIWGADRLPEISSSTGQNGKNDKNGKNGKCIILILSSVGL